MTTFFYACWWFFFVKKENKKEIKDMKKSEIQWRRRVNLRINQSINQSDDRNSTWTQVNRIVLVDWLIDWLRVGCMNYFNAKPRRAQVHLIKKCGGGGSDGTRTTAHDDETLFNKCGPIASQVKNHPRQSAFFLPPDDKLARQPLACMVNWPQ